jgi:hypothetical protein
MSCLFGRLLLVGDKRNKHYEMGYTIPEFAKTLHGQFLTEQSEFSCEEVRIKQWDVTFNQTTQKVTIKISEALPRVIAMLSLPVLDVGFQFIGCTDQQQAQFLKRFFKYFHKGGG